MTDINAITAVLKKEFPAYHFTIYRGLFEKYIAVKVNGRTIFTIWVDKNSGYKQVLDEISPGVSFWSGSIFKTRLFHWTKYRKFWRRDHMQVITEIIQLSSKTRKQIREDLELSLQNMHLTNHAI